MEGIVNEADIIQNIMDLMKQIDSEDKNTASVVSVIQSLGKLKVNPKVLKVTKAGKRMAKLSSNKNPEIQKIATEVLRDWKKQIKAVKAAESQSAKDYTSTAPSEKVDPKTLNPETPIEIHNEEATAAPIAPSRVRQADVEYEEDK